jgi:putative ABC transport system permease protein
MYADLRHALRTLAASPGFSAVAILTLALTIGATTAIFSVIDGVLLRAAPVVELDRVVIVWETDRRTATTREPGSVPDFLDYQRDARTLSAVEGVIGGEVNFAPPSGEPVRLASLTVSRGLLPMLGLAPIAGRQFTAEEDRAGGPPVAIISESLWTRSLGRAPGVIGTVIRLDERPYTVVGVMPDQTDFGMLQILTAADYSRGYADRGGRATADVWLPLQADVQELPRSTHPILMLGRLAPGASVDSAQAELTRLSAALERAYPENDARGAFVEPLDDVVYGKSRPALLMLWGAVGLVLLIGCVNVANLVLVRGRSRSREVAVRLALGAGASRLARQFLIENLVVTLTGAALGVALAAVALTTLVAVAPPDVPRLEAVAIDLRVLGVTLALAIATGLAFGLVPLVQAWRLDPQATLKSEGQHGTSSGHARRRTNRALAMAELALAVMLVIGATLLVRSFSAVLGVETGFRTSGVVKAEYQLPASRYPFEFSKWPNLPEIQGFTARVLRRASELPGVEAAAVAGAHPLDPGFTNSFQIVGREAESRSFPEISIRSVTPGYFAVTGLPLVAGRLLADGDTGDATRALVINQAAASRFFASREPVGAQIRFWGVTWTIVGVVGNEKFQGVTEADPIAAYAPVAQSPTRGTSVLIARTKGSPSALGQALAGVVREQDPALAVFGVETLDQTLLRSVGERRFAMILLALFAGLALVLAVIGVHGVLSYGVAERRRELGIRVALGAATRQITWLVVGEGLLVGSVGVAAGIAGALVTTRALSSLLFGVTATDAATYVLVALALTVVALSSTWLPARRAARVDPSQLLRE